DGANYTHGLAQRVVEELAIHRDRLAILLSHPACIVVEAIGGGHHVRSRRLTQRLAVLFADRSRERRAIFHQQVADGPENALARGGIHAAPALLLETRAGRCHRPIYLRRLT